MLSVIIPAYNEEKMIQKAAGEVSWHLREAEIDYEIIFIDDGSKDRTWETICRLSEESDKIRGIAFSRNFGKESAIFAGLDKAQGDCVAVMDSDLQHPPEKLVEMYHLWQQGYEVIEGVKKSRGEESPWHAFGARCFYKLMGKAIHMDMSRASDFKLLDRKAVNVLLNMQEKQAFFRALSSWIGFTTASVQFEVQERECGESKWSTWALVKYAVSNLASFSAAPMQIVTILGGIMLFFSLILGGIALVQKFQGVALEGFTTVIIIQLFTGSMIMISLGIIGYYIAKIYEEIKGRPRYIIAKQCGKMKKGELL
ncbi:glycosyl transferase [Anaerostipes sp. 992a]|uniref:glycosyltransferase family 2 protein n=1 Tax=Anaerostipes sp. 992a TaxID=1261637 RepID=UPI000950BE23|nr:glycosyltransferase family 2 protein [Anaerostipes sp. 992a]OLR62142.1 glycosyl transferase [Anaerostipes sp. 992a]